MKKTVPANALRFGGSVAMSADRTEALEPKPITIVARTDGPAYQGYWGKVANNMAGFIPPAGPVPLDSDHDGKLVVGVADKLAIVDGQLIADGRLIPFATGDAASEIIHKGGLGVPYQASVLIDPFTLEVHEVPAGQTEIVNGLEFSGPGVIFDKWGILGIAILPYGADGCTSVQFARGNPDIEIHFKDVPVPEEKIDPAPAPVDKAPEIDPSKFVSISDAMKFKAAFGAKGVEWMFEGKTFEQASMQFAADLQAETEALKAKLAEGLEALAALTKERDELKAKTEFRRGQPAPVPVKPAGEDDTKANAEELKRRAMSFGRTPQAQALVDAIEAKLQKAKAA